jgi:hypothetical protein
MAEPTLLQPMGLVGLFLQSFKIYIRNLPTLFVLGIILLIPAFVILVIGSMSLSAMDNPLGYGINILCSIGFYAAFIYFAASATMAVSLDTIGLKAGVIQILRRIGAKVGIQLLGTGIIQILVMFLGTILLIIPGIICFGRCLFSQSIVVLERTAYVGAIRRSMKLTKGFGWRIFLAIWIGIFGSMAVGLLFAFAIYGILTVLGMQEIWALMAAILGMYLALPVFFVYQVVLYYDLRVRKESFNVEMIRKVV